MITLEQFATMHMSPVMAMGDRQKEIEICKADGIAIEKWETGKAFYYAKMADPNDAGKTAAAWKHYIEFKEDYLSSKKL